MKRIVPLFFLFLFAALWAKADHITGGEMYYTYLGNQNGNYQYRITVKVYMRCNSGRQFNDPAIISIFDKGSYGRIADYEVALGRTETLQLTDPNRCITDPPVVCYQVGFYEFSVSLPPSANGYIVASQFVFRIAGIRNLIPFYSNIGTTYTGEIPAGANNDAQNNSARFVGSDLVAICADNNFSYSFAAEDKDGDELRYAFCEAYQGGVFRMGNAVAPAAPPYQSVPYNSNFSGGAPLGSQVKINPQTGLITGVAPGEGIYVITVCVSEIRNGKVIAVQRKDLQIFIASCTVASARLQPSYDLCRESQTLSVANQSASPLIRTYNWEVEDGSGNLLTQSNTQTFAYTFADTGTYTLKLVVNRNGECADSNTSLVRVYPGFKPAFTVQGLCRQKPTVFADATTSVYGQVNSWQWNFGEGLAPEEVRSLANPVYQYSAEGVRNVLLTVTNTVGCTDTVSKNVLIIDKPPLNLLFKDTTICINDVLQLVAQGSGSYQWQASPGLQNGQSATPLVSPTVTTTYIAELNDGGCTNQDSVLVRVVKEVTMQPLTDTTICTGDVARLFVSSNALRYNWQPAATVLENGVASPLVQPLTTTTYQVTGQIGGCTATQEVTVRTVPYPVSFAGADTAICFGTAAFLNGSITGSSFNWSPPTSLQNPESLQTAASPQSSTAYVLTVFDNRGCPKPVRDTVLIRVIPPVAAFAGRDTSVVIGQPLQLAASGGVNYTWSPASYLSATNIANPVAVFNENYYGTVRYTVQVATPEGCSDTASVLVRVFATAPSVFVPTAFTPNGDGLNDWLRPIAAGMRRVDQFLIFNRWGQLLYQGYNERGWDGRLSGSLQPAGVYVWMVKGVDFEGKIYMQKGTVALLR